MKTVVNTRDLITFHGTCEAKIDQAYIQAKLAGICLNEWINKAIEKQLA